MDSHMDMDRRKATALQRACLKHMHFYHFLVRCLFSVVVFGGHSTADWESTHATSYHSLLRAQKLVMQDLSHLSDPR